MQRHARILLKADASSFGPACDDLTIATAVEVSRATVERLRRAFATGGLRAALYRKPSRARSRRKLDGFQEAQLASLKPVQYSKNKTRTRERLSKGQKVLPFTSEITGHTVAYGRHRIGGRAEPLRAFQGRSMGIGILDRLSSSKSSILLSNRQTDSDGVLVVRYDTYKR